MTPSPGRLALHGDAAHPSHNVLGQIRGVVFSQSFQGAFQYNSFRAVRDVFFRIHHSDAVPAQLDLIYGDLFAVSSKAVDFPHDYGVKKALRAVLQHLLEFGPIIVAAGLFVVGILAYNCDIVLLGKLGALADLPFDALSVWLGPGEYRA